MVDTILTRLFANELVMFVIVIAVMLGFAEIGFRLGWRLHVARDEARKEQIGGIQGAVLGLLGLLLGFTFAMALDRYDTRRGLVVKEANAIGTTYLRSSLLPAGHQAPVRGLLRRYVDIRVKYSPLVDDPSMLSEALRLSTEIQTELWRHTNESADEKPTAITATFVEALNATIDVDAERVAAMRADIPGGVWFLLLMVAAFGCVTTNYHGGADGVRSKLASLFLPLLIAVVIILIFDISHSRVGLIRVSQQSLIDLQEYMAAHP